MGGNIPGGNFLGGNFPGGNFARTFKLSLDQKTERNLLSLSRQTKKLRNLIFLIGFFWPNDVSVFQCYYQVVIYPFNSPAKNYIISMILVNC